MDFHRWSPRRGLQTGSVRGQHLWLLLACVVALTLVWLAPLAHLLSQGDIVALDLLSDPAEVTDILRYVGAVSDLNLLVWAAGAAVCTLAAFGLRHAEGHLAATLGWLAVVTVVLTLDERFLSHEIVLPWLFGLSQPTTFVLYGLALMVLFRRVLPGQPEAGTLLLAVGALGASVSLDVLGRGWTVRRGAEETAKLLGAVTWALFPATIVDRHLNDTEHTGSSRPARG